MSNNINNTINNTSISTFNNKSSRKIRQELERIAKRHFNTETLETRNRDELDFYDVAIWNIREALEAAYRAGHEQGMTQCRASPQKTPSPKPSPPKYNPITACLNRPGERARQRRIARSPFPDDFGGCSDNYRK